MDRDDTREIIDDREENLNLTPKTYREKPAPARLRSLMSNV